MNRWMDKDEACTHNEILLSYIKKNLAICDNMGGPRGYYTKSNKPEKDKYHMTLLICAT